MRRIIINNICINTLAFLILVLPSCGPSPTEDIKCDPVNEKILTVGKTYVITTDKSVDTFSDIMIHIH